MPSSRLDGVFRVNTFEEAWTLDLHAQRDAALLNEKAILREAVAQAERAERVRCAILKEDATARTSAAETLAADVQREMLVKRAQVQDLQRQRAAAQTGLLVIGDNAASRTDLHRETEQTEQNPHEELSQQSVAVPKPPRSKTAENHSDRRPCLAETRTGLTRPLAETGPTTVRRSTSWCRFS